MNQKSALVEDWERFFEFIYGTESGYAYSATKDPQTDQFDQHFFEWPSKRNELAEHVHKYYRTHEVYYAPALLKEPTGAKAAFKGSHFVWCEFDGNAPQSIEGLPEPNIKIQSSKEGNEHWYWKLSEFTTDITVIEALSQKIAYYAEADIGCWNANRILRPPGTYHHESGMSVRVLRRNYTPTFTVDSFKDIPELDVSSPLKEEDIGAVPPVLDVIAKYQWNHKDITFFREKEIPKGHRSHALTKLGHICMEMGMRNSETLSILLHADTRWGKYSRRSNQKKCLVDIINYCRSHHPVDAVIESDKLKVYTLEEFINTEFTFEWMIPNLLHKGGLMCISGPPGVGKSQMAVRLAERMVRGEEMLGWKPQDYYRVLIISMEMSFPELRLFVDTMDIPNGELVNENLLFLPVGSSINLNSSTGKGEIVDVMEAYRPDMVVVDSLGTSVGDEGNTDRTIKEIVEFSKQTLKGHYGSSVIFIHHPRKAQVGNKKPTGLDDLSGNHYFIAGMDSILGMYPEGNTIEVSCLKMRMSEGFNKFHIYRTKNLDFEKVNDKSVPLFSKSDSPESDDM